MPPIPPLYAVIRGQTGQVYAASEISSLYHDDARTLEQKYGKVIAPRFEIEISNSNEDVLWSAESMLHNGAYDLNGLIINNVEYEEDIEGAAAITLTINNPDLTLQDSRIFAEGNNIDLWMGYDGRPGVYMGRGIIVEIEPEFPADGMPTIKIKAYDKSYFMMEEEKAEISPEGSEWYERRSERAIARTPLQDRMTRNDSYRDQPATEEEDAEDARFNTLAEQQGYGSEFIPRTTLDEEMAEGYDPTGRRISGVTVDDWDEDDNLVTAPLTRQGWQRQNFGRRRRQAGKVWREKTDSEIVAAIFLSYGIDPYVESTCERTGSPRSRPITRHRRSERTGHPNDPGLEGYVVLEEVGDLGVLDPTRSGDYVALLEQGFDPFDEDTRGIALFNREPGDGVRSEIGQLGNDAEELGEDENFSDRARYTTVSPEVIDFLDAEQEREGVARTSLDTTPLNSSTQRHVREVTQKAGTTDWEFITKLAEQHGFIVFVFFHLDTLRWIGYWGPEGNVPQAQEYIWRYNYGDESTLGTVRPNISLRNQPTEIDLLYVDPISRKTNRLRVAIDNLNPVSPAFNDVVSSPQLQEPIGDGPEVVLSLHGQRVRTHANHRFTSAEDARNWLVAFWYRHAQEFMLIEGDTIVGIPEMRARQKHQFLGIGRFSGRYFVTAARHSMSPGSVYKTSFNGRHYIDFSGDVPGDDSFVLDQETLGEPTPDITE